MWHWLTTITVNHKNNCTSHTDLEKNIIIRMYISSWVTKLLVSALHTCLLKRDQDSKGNRKSLYFIRQKKKSKSPTFKKNWKRLQLKLLSTFTTASFAEASPQQQKNNWKYLSRLICPPLHIRNTHCAEDDSKKKNIKNIHCVIISGHFVTWNMFEYTG